MQAEGDQGGSDSLDPTLTLFGEAGQSPSKEKTWPWQTEYRQIG